MGDLSFNLEDIKAVIEMATRKCQDCKGIYPDDFTVETARIKNGRYNPDLISALHVCEDGIKGIYRTKHNDFFANDLVREHLRKCPLYNVLGGDAYDVQVSEINDEGAATGWELRCPFMGVEGTEASRNRETGLRSIGLDLGQ